MRALLERRPPTIFGDGEQTRDWTYVEDVAALCVKAADAQGVGGQMYNAGNGERCSLNRVWQILQQIEGVSLPPQYAPPRQGDVRDSQADRTAVNRDLGHVSRYTLEQGLRRTLDWYRMHQSNHAPISPAPSTHPSTTLFEF
jgi:UDP-glucose 4-epimerase